MLRGTKRVTIGMDKAYDCKEFVTALRSLHVTPHVTQKKKSSAIDGRTTRHQGYAISQRKLKQAGGRDLWLDEDCGLAAQGQIPGQEKIDWLFTFSAAAYNMVRMRNLEMFASG